jgi:hypothetical protein
MIHGGRAVLFRREAVIQDAARIWRPITNTDKARDSPSSTLRRSLMKQSILNRMRIFTALAGVVLAFAGFVHAASVGTQRSQKAEKAKKGTLKIATTSNVGGLRLEPGEYEVKL